MKIVGAWDLFVVMIIVKVQEDCGMQLMIVVLENVVKTIHVLLEKENVLWTMNVYIQISICVN